VNAPPAMPRKVRVEWRNLITNETGHGNCMSESEAVHWLVLFAESYPDEQHWVSTCKPGAR
jgi:hypothetical protein